MTAHNVLVIGSGGREHVLAWALSRSRHVKQVFVAPGNAGTAWPAQARITGLNPCAGSRNVPVDTGDFEALIAFARDNDVALTVVGPEAPLAAGVVDAFQAAGFSVFGPTKAAAQLEASKAFSKDFMRDHQIATAAYGVFTDFEDACEFAMSFDGPVVVKADGLAAGKGVLVCDSVEEAHTALQTVMVDRAFGAAGDRVVIEERMSGREISVLAFADGQSAVPLVVARDHKRALDGDKGLNTGGMGAFAPTTDVPQSLIDDILRTVIQPVIDGMAARGTPYVGVLYAGLMLTEAGPKVLEFNCRLGDPEAQVILPLLESDLFEVLQACLDGRLAETELRWQSRTCATVVLASPGYPEQYPKGLPISGLDQLDSMPDVIAFHAGTAAHDNQIVTAGGRVLAITAVGDDLDSALDLAYQGVAQVHFDGMHYRRDIGRTHESSQS